MSDSVKIKVEFTGGLEMLFANKRQLDITIAPSKETNQAVTIADLISKLTIDLEERHQKKDLFVLDGSVRPGILVLINDADWELEGEDKYELQNGDNIIFVSTLHGG